MNVSSEAKLSLSCLLASAICLLAPSCLMADNSTSNTTSTDNTADSAKTHEFDVGSVAGGLKPQNLIFNHYGNSSGATTPLGPPAINPKYFIYKSLGDPNGNKGYINTAVVIEQYQKTREYNGLLDKLVAQKKKERQPFVDRIKELREKSLQLSGPAAIQTRRHLRQTVSELQAFSRRIMDWCKGVQNTCANEVFADMEKATQAYGKAHDFGAIVDIRGSSEGEDVTLAVLKQLNDGYRPGSGRLLTRFGKNYEEPNR